MQCVSMVVGFWMDPIKKEIDYVISSATYVTDMRRKMNILDVKEVDVQRRVEANNRNNQEIPAQVPEWLIEVGKIKEDVESISTDGSSRFNVKMNYEIGKRASKITEDIDRLIQEYNETHWTNSPIPLARVSSIKASTSAPLGGEFKSRDMIFKNALKFLVDQKTQLIALCGMPGVGKTTMMKQLKEAVDNKTMFHWIVNTSIGQTKDLTAIQQAIAAYTDILLPKETTKEAGAELLHKRFMTMSKEGKERILVIMDDVWGMIKLDDIGLNPLPKGLKLLLTSRDENVCKQIAAEANLVVEVIRVDVLEEEEAHDLFCRIAGVSEESNRDHFQIGRRIVKECGFLPIAINLIATTLKFKEDFHWRVALNRLKNNDLPRNLQEIFKMSYESLDNNEIKEIFLLCGLFPEDSDIPIEELTRYAWGLQLLDNVSALKIARDKTRSYIDDLKSANLLIASDRRGCVKMHDLVLAFVLSVVSKREHRWIVNHGNMSEISWNKPSEPCEKISLTCTGMSQFPGDLTHEYPNLSFLKLMDRDESRRFPEHFYGRMKELKHIVFEDMQYPSLQFSTNLRTLCLHSCLLLDEISHIGNLTNLEILSFANSGIQELPSTIKNLKQLKLLDVTGCIDLRIDDGILENLVRLEELYMRVADEKGIKFTDKNCEELDKLSRNFFALEVEFFQNNVEPKNVSFEKLERFRISIGCFLEVHKNKDAYSFENTLMLVSKREELLESRINKLFHKTNILHLKVDGMNNLEDVSMKSLDHSPQSFDKLRVLKVSKCSDLTYLFSLSIVKGLSQLEHLEISGCPNLEELIHNEANESEVITFQKLKFLFLDHLPKLVSLCRKVDVIDMPELVKLKLHYLPNFTSIFPKKKSTSDGSSNMSRMQSLLVATPKLEILHIYQMEKLKEIWPSQISSSEELNICRLRKIDIRWCDSLVNLFPSIPMRWLRHLERLLVYNCGSVEMIFDLDLGCFDEIEEEYNSNLREIDLHGLRKLKEVWRMRGVNNSHPIIHTFQGVTKIHISYCESYRNLFTPTTVNFDLGAVEKIEIRGCGGWGEREKRNELGESEETQIPSLDISRSCLTFGGIPCSFSNLVEVYVEFSESTENVIPSNVLLQLKMLEKIYVRRHSCEAVFEASNGTDTGLNESQSVVIIPKLRQVELIELHDLKCIWKSNQWTVMKFPSLTRLVIERCENLKHVFSCSMVGGLLKLQDLHISSCENMELIVKEAEYYETKTEMDMFPCLKSLKLENLPQFKGFYLGKEAITWPSLDSLEIKACSKLTVFTNGELTTPELKVIDTSFGWCYVKEDLNSFINTKKQKGFKF